MMNRQMRRIQEKSDRKKDKERAEKLAAKRAKVGARKEAKSTESKAPVSRPTRPRNRFLGILTAVNIVIVVSGLFIAPADPAGPTTTELFMNSLLYITLGYFLCRWLIGRGFGERSLWLSVAAGLALGLGLEVAKLFVAGLTPNPLALAFILPALLLGSVGGRFIDRKLHGPA
jgi:hypothetical protein